MISITISGIIRDALIGMGVVEPDVQIEYPLDRTLGDIATNVALAYAKKLNKKPLVLALELVEYFTARQPVAVEKVEVAGPGFINVYLTPAFFATLVAEVRSSAVAYGVNDMWKGKTVMVEYTDPNPFKIFHIGHLMSNTIGEAFARLISKSGARVVRVNYQGDVGRHVALLMWGIRFMEKPFPEETVPLTERIQYLGAAYATGSQKFYADEAAHADEIQRINKVIYERSDEEVNALYDSGREWSLEYFETLYKKLGTAFDHYFFESQVADEGIRLVKEFLAKGVFVENDGAIVFKGEEVNPSLHTRVFLNSQGLPTYEAKELGLAFAKEKVCTVDMSIVVTANEQTGYFRVVHAALAKIAPAIAAKTRHVDHGILKLPTGKMSSRTGDVVAAESLIGTVTEAVMKRLDERDIVVEQKVTSAEQIAIAALKYTILKQSPGKDVIFNLEQAISFEGDSGPYLQYAYTRARSILEKAAQEGVTPKESNEYISSRGIERLLLGYPNAVERAAIELSPQLVATHMVQLAGAFNSWYADEKIINAADSLSPARVALTEAVLHTLASGIELLGMSLPNKM